MIHAKVWFLKIQTQMRLRLTGASASQFKAILSLPDITEKPEEWWANLGEKGQLISIPRFAAPSDIQEVADGESVERYSAGMTLTLRREEGNRIAIQLPIEAFHQGVVPDVGAKVALYVRSNSLEVWKAEQWKEDAIQTASILSAHLARSHQSEL